jgi:hypothetical protein
MYHKRSFPINLKQSEADSMQEIIDGGNMEELATLVLNGDGKRLIGLGSKQPDIQAFLDNVPAYMVR